MLFGRQIAEDTTVVDMLASALRRDIAFGKLRPDQKLKLTELRSLYGGSNHSMRETLRKLEVEGLVEAVAQRGFRVTSATEEDLCDIRMLRIELEKLALTRAITRGDVDWEGRIIAAHHRLRKAEDALQAGTDDLLALEWDEACRVFSAAIVSACDSPRLVETQARIFNQSRYFRLALLREGRLDFGARRDQQQALLDAVLARDTARALAVLEASIEAETRL
ncbi:MAG: GntR family transcriptional regulator [Silicimonas sp.]|nr:GntR family transcriptional regulator [Silicimonas sp.]